MPFKTTYKETYTVTYACNDEPKAFNDKKTRDMCWRLHCKKCAICSDIIKIETNSQKINKIR